MRAFSGFRLFGHVQTDCADDSSEAVNHGHAEDSVGFAVMGNETCPHWSYIVRSPCRGILNAGDEDVSQSWETGVMRRQPETPNHWLPDDNKSPKHESLMGPLNHREMNLSLNQGVIRQRQSVGMYSLQM